MRKGSPPTSSIWSACRVTSWPRRILGGINEEGFGAFYTSPEGRQVELRVDRGTFDDDVCTGTPVHNAADGEVTCSQDDVGWYRVAGGRHEYVALRGAVLIRLDGETADVSRAVLKAAVAGARQAVDEGERVARRLHAFRSNAATCRPWETAPRTIRSAPAADRSGSASRQVTAAAIRNLVIHKRGSAASEHEKKLSSPRCPADDGDRGPGNLRPADERTTRSLLGYGIIAGPVFVVVSLAQALTRDGFDLARHP